MLFEYHNQAPPLFSDRRTSSFVESGATCDIPDEATPLFTERPLTTTWKQFTEDNIGIRFRYPPDWNVSESNGVITVTPPYQRAMPMQGDSGRQYGITIDEDAGGDENWLPRVISEEEVLTGLSDVKYPVRTRWFQSGQLNALVAYCIYDFDSGVSALIPVANHVLHVAISRFSEGTNRPEDWNTFFGILWSLEIHPTDPAAKGAGQ